MSPLICFHRIESNRGDRQIPRPLRRNRATRRDARCIFDDTYFTTTTIIIITFFFPPKTLISTSLFVCLSFISQRIDCSVSLFFGFRSMFKVVYQRLVDLGVVERESESADEVYDINQQVEKNDNSCKFVCSLVMTSTLVGCRFGCMSCYIGD